MNILSLHGCAPVPLAHYLKALGVLRLVSEQYPDSGATGHWQGNTFVLTSTLDRDALLQFFLEAYQPTPIIAPWNGGSGFFPKDNKAGIEPIQKTEPPRFARFQQAISVAESCLAELKLSEKPDSKEAKEALLTLCRNQSSDEALEWLDCAYVLTDDGAKYPPLLGTGGNDGRLEFTNNLMQRLAELFDLPSGNPVKECQALLDNALFGGTAPVLVNGAIGQFSPAAGGGFNASTGFDAPSAMNPWDYVLMMEGAILFAGAAVKRLETAQIRQLVYPFCVKQAGVGYGSATLSDEENSRCEMWLPLWQQPAGLPELQALLSEGRAQVGGRSARNGVDFARAVATLGVDRGIGAFQRYGFQVRNGLAYFATPLDRVIVKRNQLASQLLAPLDQWLERFRRAARTDGAPASVQRAARNLEAAIMAFCKASDRLRVQELLISLGECEKALASSWKWTTKKEVAISPLPLLGPEWLEAANTGTTEFWLAASLASTTANYKGHWLPLRCHLEPVAQKNGHAGGRFLWTENIEANVVWREGNFAEALNDILARRIILAVQNGCKSYLDTARIPARSSDIALFIEHRTDDALISCLLWGLSLIDFSAGELPMPEVPSGFCEPPAFYALLKLCFIKKLGETEISLVPAIHRRARAGYGFEASELASRRLRASGLTPAIQQLSASGVLAQRSAAALLFYLGKYDLSQQAERVLRPMQSNRKSTNITTTTENL